jgi:PAS domain S-box-containing protein
MSCSDQDLNHFFDLSIDMLCIAGKDGYFKRINQAFEQTLGYSQEELLAKPFVEFVHPDDVPDTLAELEKLTAGVPTIYFEHRYRCKDGSFKWLSWTASPVDGVFYCVARDVTRDKQLVLAYEASETRFRALLETASVAIVVIDDEGQMMMVNSKTEEIFGYHREELLGEPVDKLLPEQLWDAHKRHRANFFDNPHPRPMGIEYDLVGQEKDGSQFPVEVALSFIELESATLGVGFIVDVTERKRVEKEREQLIEDLEAFAHTVAHDLKSPLSIIRGYVDLLNTDYDDISDAEKREFLQILDETGRQMHNIIDELLLLASVRQADMVNLTPIDMGAIVASAQKRLALEIQKSQAQVILPTTWPSATGYAAWIEEVWVNYLSNAIKYGGKPPRLELGSQIEPDGMVRYWVRDNGAGIWAKELSRLFTPFTRLDQVQARGHGLGLSIVRRIVEKLNGRVGVESEVGQGSTFYFSLPPAEVL